MHCCDAKIAILNERVRTKVGGLLESTEKKGKGERERAHHETILNPYFLKKDDARQA